MSDKSDTTDFNYGPGMKPFMDQVKKTLVEQSDYTGIGGHDAQDHGGHGEHTQTSIGMGNKTINFREQSK